MPEFNEDFLQFIWQNKLLKPLPLISVSGKEIIIQRFGELNRNSGPDFFNAQIKVDHVILVGNIEVHLKTGDWLKHGHTKDKNYDNIILHVVYEHDISLKQNSDHGVEVLELKKLIHPESLKNYQLLFSNKEKIPCSKLLTGVSELSFLAWLERMAIERLEEKVKRLEEWFTLSDGDFSQTFYINLLRSFGFKVNAEPFEMLARELPINLLLKHSDNLFQLEALLLGFSGLIDGQYTDKYIRALQNEFEYLKTKYGLIPLKKEVFKFSKLRPANFPTLRLAQFALLVHTQTKLFSYPLQAPEQKELQQSLLLQPENYWKNHYLPDGQETSKILRFGSDSIEKVVINAFAPYFFFYGKKSSKGEFQNLALELLYKCGFEDNYKTKLFAAKKPLLKSAAESQALINLYDNYCRFKKCLHCNIAVSVLNPKAGE